MYAVIELYLTFCVILTDQLIKCKNKHNHEANKKGVFN